jgi:hypothetical protein
MAEKRTKSDKAQRRADQLERKARHAAPKKKKTPRKDFSQAAVRMMKEANGGTLGR